MGQQSDKVIKRKRRTAYLRRKVAGAKVKAKKARRCRLNSRAVRSPGPPARNRAPASMAAPSPARYLYMTAKIRPLAQFLAVFKS